MKKKKPDLVSVENNSNRVLFKKIFLKISPGQLSHLQVCRDTPTQDKCVDIKQVERGTGNPLKAPEKVRLALHRDIQGGWKADAQHTRAAHRMY